MAGAALLAGRAALKLGAGRVYCGMLETPRGRHRCAELMLRHPDDVLGLDLDAIVIGPGLGQSERAETLLGAILASELPCVLDADALNLIAENEDLRKACARRNADTLLTPAPGRSRAPARRNHRRRPGRPAQGRARPVGQPERARRPQGQRQHRRRARRPLVRQHLGQSRHGLRRHGRRAGGHPRRPARAEILGRNRARPRHPPARLRRRRMRPRRRRTGRPDRRRTDRSRAADLESGWRRASRQRSVPAGQALPQVRLRARAADTNPAWQCPKCRIAYAKFRPGARLSPRVLPRVGAKLAAEARADRSVFVLIAANLLALLIAWPTHMRLRELMLVVLDPERHHRHLLRHPHPEHRSVSAENLKMNNRAGQPCGARQQRCEDVVGSSSRQLRASCPAI